MNFLDIILTAVVLYLLYVVYVYNNPENFTNTLTLEIAKQIVDFFKTSPDAQFVNYIMFLDQIHSTIPDLALPDTFKGGCS